MSVTPEQMAWLNFVKTTSLPLRRLNSSNIPDSVASGCIVTFEGRKFVLSVAHATGKGDKWAAELRHDTGKGTFVYTFGATYFLEEHDLLTGKKTDVDFSYSEVDSKFEAWFQILDRTGVILSEERRPEFAYARHEPTLDETYAFAGQVRTQIQSSNELVSEMVVYPGLRFQRTENGKHIFRLPVAHPGHDAFRGCSGAPILDTQRRVVALVSSGSMKDDTITGVSLAKYGGALAAHVLTNSVGQ